MHELRDVLRNLRLRAHADHLAEFGDHLGGEGAAAPGYEKCLNEDITLNIGAKKMVRQETEDSAFSDSPILRN